MRIRCALLASAGVIALVATGCGDDEIGRGAPAGAETFQVPTYGWDDATQH